MKRPEDWLMQVPFRRYMKEPGPICGSVSPQSEDRPSHKEIPLRPADARLRTTEPTSVGRRNAQMQWRSARRTMSVVIFATTANADPLLGFRGLKRSEAAKSVLANWLNARFGRPSRHDSDSLASQGRLQRLRSAAPRSHLFPSHDRRSGRR